MKPTQEQVIAWAREAAEFVKAKSADELDEAYAVKFAALAYEAGRKDENEACAKVCMEDASLMRGGTPPQIALMEAADAIRARREQ